MTAPVPGQLRDFAVSLLEWRGALVDWEPVSASGTAVLPPDAASTLQCPETVSLSAAAADDGLAVNLAADFLERIEPLLDQTSRNGVFRSGDMYLKQSRMDEPVSRAFTWLNARVRVSGARPDRIEYHLWHFHASFRSDDRWEDVFSLAINSRTGATVPIPRLDEIHELQPDFEPETPAIDTFPFAAQLARRTFFERASPFLSRMERRLERDRKRLNEYYRALAQEMNVKTARLRQETPMEEKTRRMEDQNRAVRLELKRKLMELDERYAILAELTPLALVRLNLPVLAVECDVTRKQASRAINLYWNPMMKELEPLSCSRCGAATFAMAFTDENVEPVCPCHARRNE